MFNSIGNNMWESKQSFRSLIYKITLSADLKVPSSQAKIYAIFDNNFKTKANNKSFIVLNVHVKGYRKT